MENEIGSILKTYQNEYDRDLGYWNSRIIPSINRLADAYNALQLPELFDQNVFNDLRNNQLKNVKASYEKMIEGHSAQFKSQVFTSLVKDNVNIELQPLKDALNKVLAEELNANVYTSSIGSLSLNDCFIVNGKATVNSDKALLRYQIRIEDETQLVLLQHLQRITSAFNETKDYLKDAGVNLSRYQTKIIADEIDPGYSLNFLIVDNDSNLSLRPEAIQAFLKNK